MPIVIVEGPDNAGKTTLINHMASTLGLNYVPGEGPAKSSEEINERVKRYAKIDNAIFDRHPCISQAIYNKFRINAPVVMPHLVREFYAREKLIIFCVGKPNIEGHVVKPHDERVDAAGTRHADLVNENHLWICEEYEEWALKHANVIYRLGEGFRRVTEIVEAYMNPLRFNTWDPMADIVDFHTKFSLGYDGPPRALPKEIAEFRTGFMREEIDEYHMSNAMANVEAGLESDKRDLANYTYHLENVLDALVDEMYVVLGTAYLQGFGPKIFKEAWNRVHAANMTKVRATDASDSKRNSIHDVVKPLEFKPPRHVDLVELNDLSLQTSKL